MPNQPFVERPYDTEPKIPLSPTQEESLLSFVKSDKVYYKYYDELIILLGTGLRISEFCGLTDRDIDFENRTINVDHQLQYSGKKSQNSLIFSFQLFWKDLIYL